METDAGDGVRLVNNSHFIGLPVCLSETSTGTEDDCVAVGGSTVTILSWC